MSEKTKAWAWGAILVACVSVVAVFATPKEKAHAEAVAAHLWYSTLGRCAPSVRAAVDKDPALWVHDIRIGKCRPSARDGEQFGPIEVCMVEHLVGGARVTEPLAVDCSAGAIIGLTPQP